MRHRRLFTIAVEHGYYAGVCPALSLAPRPDTAKALAGHRLLARPRPDGVEVVAAVDDADADRCFITPAADLRLRFDLRPQLAKLAHFTDLAPLRQHAWPRFVNADGRAALSLTLGAGDRPPARDALAVVEIAGIEDGWLADPPRFTVNLAAREARWVYYYVGDADKKLTIVDRDPARANAPLSFDVEAAAADGDRVAASLAERYPDRVRLRLISRQVLACSEQPRRHLALEGARVIASELPNPGLDKQSTVERDGQRQDSLYHVVIT